MLKRKYMIEGVTGYYRGRRVFYGPYLFWLHAVLVCWRFVHIYPWGECGIYDPDAEGSANGVDCE